MPSVAGSYQRARDSRIDASVGSVLVWVRHTSSKGPPVQRIGTHVSGAEDAEAASVHNSKKSKLRHGTLSDPIGERVATDSPYMTKLDRGKGVVLPENQSWNTGLRARLAKICDSDHELTHAN